MKKKLTLLVLIIVTNVYCQNDFQKEINGTWKVKKMIMNNNTSIDFGEYLKFINNEIHFFKMESGKEIEESIKKIVFINYPIKNVSPEHRGGQLIKFENEEIWELWLRDINNEKRLIWQLRITKDGEYVIKTDDRGIIKDPEARKKALEDEINTYYIKLQ
ncbi:hypothetical protein FLJC2902T_31670 [Flavobacterium limnosediminis JC2902]|uniref:Lipocalin-like domain-containing protein n=1 Tax=Flavobacterium limnosediminis JC2902 TaxID=1341181 RepID=V6SF86_9FLAO|nr:hypothetical protein [Flavobacterium limnosediminis]ESU25226.1 hypothetical protein FLJC2902T_31670 [Flavobacterium limnosediminis JC2902]